MKYNLNLNQIKRIVDKESIPGFSLSTSVNMKQQKSFSYGYFSTKNSNKVLVDTLYDIASITKLFTTAIILRLHENNGLNIYQECSNFLENFENSRIRIIDLLTHKVNFNVKLLNYRTIYPDSFEQQIMKITPPKNSSKKVYYGNLGFIYLGKIIEKVSKTDLNSVVRSLIRELGLSRTTTGVNLIADSLNCPPTERINNSNVQNVTHDESARLIGGIAGNAGIFASSQDLVKFGQAWLNYKIINRTTLERLVFKNYDLSGENPQAIGWWIRIPLNRQLNTPGVFSHTGFTGSFLAINPSVSKVCAFTCNRTYYGRDNAKHKQMWKMLTKWIME